MERPHVEGHTGGPGALGCWGRTAALWPPPSRSSAAEGFRHHTSSRATGRCSFQGSVPSSSKSLIGMGEGRRRRGPGVAPAGRRSIAGVAEPRARQGPCFAASHFRPLIGLSGQEGGDPGGPSRRHSFLGVPWPLWRTPLALSSQGWVLQEGPGEAPWRQEPERRLHSLCLLARRGTCPSL